MMFWKKKKEEKVVRDVDKLLNALVLLEEVGMSVKDIYAKKELIEKARAQRGEIDEVGPSPLLLAMDTEWSVWVDKKEFQKRKKKDKKGVEGMMFGVNFRVNEDSE